MCPPDVRLKISVLVQVHPVRSQQIIVSLIHVQLKPHPLTASLSSSHRLTLILSPPQSHPVTSSLSSSHSHPLTASLSSSHLLTLILSPPHSHPLTASLSSCHSACL
ncbi:Hypothetical predicted protein [Xyrichtys novacula]|uniref:Uncharacterized protein n=1 Tax=Xyrichtys novacula TaxID=13765 RepID=A0AAV1FF87_XYRNO|nr:Hypothetical predicted protein [Xyrichtys novacula]